MRQLSVRAHMGDGGGWGGMGGYPPPLASNNLSPPLEQKIKDLQNKIREKKGKLRAFFKKNLLFKSEELISILIKKPCVFFFLLWQNSQFSPAEFFCPPLPPLYPSPRRGKSIPSPRAILGVLQFLKHCSPPPLEKSRRPCVHKGVR